LELAVLADGAKPEKADAFDCNNYAPGYVFNGDRGILAIDRTGGISRARYRKEARRRTGRLSMDRLTLFGLFAVTSMLVCYALEHRGRRYILAFAFSCALGSAYGFLQGAWPFGLVEAVWAMVALWRWRKT
jgi:hypothetical protein